MLHVRLVHETTILTTGQAGTPMRQPHLNLTRPQQEKLSELGAQIACMLGGFQPSHHELGREVFDLGLVVLEARLASGAALHGEAGYQQILGESQAHASLPQAALSPAEREQIRDTLREALRPGAAA